MDFFIQVIIEDEFLHKAMDILVTWGASIKTKYRMMIHYYEWKEACDPDFAGPYFYLFMDIADVMEKVKEIEWLSYEHCHTISKGAPGIY